MAYDLGGGTSKSHLSISRLDILRLAEGPITAAAIAYGVDQNKNVRGADEGLIIAYDIGGATLTSYTRTRRCIGIWVSPSASVSLSLPWTNIPLNTLPGTFSIMPQAAYFRVVIVIVIVIVIAIVLESNIAHPLLCYNNQGADRRIGRGLTCLQRDQDQDEPNEPCALDEGGKGSERVSGKRSQKAGQGGTLSNEVSSKGQPGLKTTGQLSSEQPSTSPTQLPVIHPFPAKIAKDLLRQSMPPPDPNARKQPKRYTTQRLLPKPQLARLPSSPHDKMPAKPPLWIVTFRLDGLKRGRGGAARIHDLHLCSSKPYHHRRHIRMSMTEW